MVVIGKKSDFFLIKFPILFPLLYILFLYFLEIDENLLVLMTLLILGESHFGATWPFLINKYNLKMILKNSLYYIQLPILIIITSSILFFTKAEILFLIFYLANFYHVTRQSSGIFKLLSNSSKSNLSISINLIYFFGFLFLIVGILRFYFNYNFIESNLLIFNLFIFALIILVIAFHLTIFRSLNSSIILSTGIIMFFPICFVDKPIHAIVMGVTMHYVQYLAMTYKVHMKRFSDKKSLYYFLIIIILYSGLMTFSTHISSNMNLFQFMLIIPITGQLLHFYYDTLLWKFSEAHNREVTLSFLKK